MPKLPECHAFIACSLDGFIARPDGDIAWLTSLPVPEGEDFGYAAFVAGMDAILMGRGSYEKVLILPDADPAALIGVADEVWTLTSLLGFEALIRGKRVTCLGLPFYAGWGLTRDLAAPPARRSARPTLAALVHAALIACPRYVDPGTGRPCPVEVIVDRLAARPQPEPPLVNRGLAGLQRLIPAALRRG